MHDHLTENGNHTMMRIRIEETLREQWSPVIARHFQMALASSASDMRSLAVSFQTERTAAVGHPVFVCELRGRHREGGEIRVRSAHADGEVAIGHAFARTRREIRRGLGLNPRQTGDRALPR
jgi:hypothetical protein